MNQPVSVAKGAESREPCSPAPRQAIKQASEREGDMSAGGYGVFVWTLMLLGESTLSLRGSTFIKMVLKGSADNALAQDAPANTRFVPHLKEGPQKHILFKFKVNLSDGKYVYLLKKYLQRCFFPFICKALINKKKRGTIKRRERQREWEGRCTVWFHHIKQRNGL